MFIAVLFTIAKIWKQLKCPSTDECIKIWYKHIYSMEYHSAIISSVAQSCPTLCDRTDCSTPGLPIHQQWHLIVWSNMSHLGEHYANWNKSEINTELYHSYVESKKYNKLVTITKKKQIDRYKELTFGYQWKGWERATEEWGGVGAETTKVGSKMSCLICRI